MKVYEEEKEQINEKNLAIDHKNNALNRLDMSFKTHIDKSEYKISHLLSYWIIDYSKYHDEEKIFSSAQLKTFKRGDIIKVNLGFNIGNELGGLHYCIVLNKRDNPYSNTLNIIPLSSFKENKKYNENNTINLGDEIFSSIDNKLKFKIEKIQKHLKEMQEKVDFDDMKAITSEIEYLGKIKDELSNMKHGSIALINQITTISKQRIFNSPILSGIKLSNENLDLIDEKIIKLFTK